MYSYQKNRNIEKETKKNLFEYLRSLDSINIEKNIDDLMDINGGLVSRFEYFNPFLDKQSKKKLLISGCSVGSEMIIAKRYGFKEIYGTEVAEEYVKIAKNRLSNDISFHVDFYNGEKLPYKNNFFSMICSGHIIEHTVSPFIYIKEHLRVLKKNGFFFIEFPSRYHTTELHTGLKSYEKLPLPLRSLFLKYLSRKNKTYKKILKELRPMSLWQIRFYCILSLYKCVIVDICKPAPGYIRILILKK